MTSPALPSLQPSVRRTFPASSRSPAPPPALVSALSSEPKLVAKYPALGSFPRHRWADAAFMTAAGMAEATGLPVTTLLRLLALLGYPRFRSFREAVRQQLRGRVG
ncbi:MAG: hypothetical protein J0I79_29420 [Mesorhizobium sp.]|uniref:hypothetical protein n=1 Tax=Mesorhizobium sp. TaxID=1871066 RepID=UPI001AC32A00|nr:hypothetical protein [Mesorhizobium sp.]MBN9222080.1 hypothetical protein [Mesorhizobium sp.]